MSPIKPLPTIPGIESRMPWLTAAAATPSSVPGGGFDPGLGMLPVTGTGSGAGPGPAPIIDTGAIATQVPGHQWPHSLQQLIAMARGGQFPWQQHQNGQNGQFHGNGLGGHHQGGFDPGDRGWPVGVPPLPLPPPTGDHPPPMQIPPPAPGGVIGPRGIHLQPPPIRPGMGMRDWRIR